jgi:serine protease Do
MTHRSRPAGYCFALLFLLAGAALRGDDAAPSEDRRTPIVRAIERTKNATVNIHSEKRAKTAEVLFSAGKDKKINGMGTGIIVDERGYIITNYHVVKDVESLRVTTCDGAGFDARVISYDSREDLAIIKIDSTKPLPVMPFGTSSDLMLGEDVLAIGNAFGYEHTVTRGIISALSRDVEVDEEQSYRNLIQIDAAINPGNSGGPLLNRDGDVIGINVAIRAGAQRIGFAIPIDDARIVLARLLNIERLNSNFHGLELIDEKHGAERKLVVRAAKPGSPADSAGLKAGDVIVKAGDVNVVDSADLERAFLGRAAGDKVEVQVQRDGNVETLPIEIATLGPERRVPAIRALPNDAPPAPPVAAGDAVEKTWSLLGLKLSKVQTGDQSLTGQPYRGGMLVTDVRPQSPAQKNGLRNGDVLVGLHVWETVSTENITYVLSHPQFSNFNPLKFYVLRNRETLYGFFDISASTASHSQ